MAVKDEKIEVEGEVVEALPSTMFRVELEGRHGVLATISREAAQALHRILPGDCVEVELSPDDPTAAASPSVSGKPTHQEPT